MLLSTISQMGEGSERELPPPSQATQSPLPLTPASTLSIWLDPSLAFRLGLRTYGSLLA